MDISLLNILRNVSWDFRRDMAQNYANALKNAIELHVSNDTDKPKGYFLSLKGCKTARGNFEDKLYIGNIHCIESHLYWNDEELADDDQVIDVVVIDGPVTRDGGACSLGTKDWRDQVMYANTIPQVVGHIFYINTPGGESACRNDYEMMIADCREKGKPTVAFVDGMCCSSGVNLACRCDRTIVMNPKDDFGCIGSMAAFWATPDGAVDRDGTRYVEIVGGSCPEKNDWYRNAAFGDYEKLQKMVDKDTEEFHQTVRDNRPLVEDSMLTGDTFEAQEVIPQLIDEIGDMNRAIQCIFDLADGNLTPAYQANGNGTQKPSNGPDPNNSPDPQNEPVPDKPEAPESPEDEPELSKGNNQEMNKPNAQQKTAMDTGHDVGIDIDNGHVIRCQADGTKIHWYETADPQSQNNNNMKEEEEKNQETMQTEQGQEQHAPEKGRQAEEAASAKEGYAATDEGAHEPGNADALEKAKDALKSAEGIIADRDKEIAERDGEIAELKKAIGEKEKMLSDAIAGKDDDIAERDKSIADKDTTIARLEKQVADLQGEVKELANTATPMNDGDGGVPKDNGMGAAETGTVKSVITADMTPEEISETLRKQDRDTAARRRRR